MTAQTTAPAAEAPVAAPGRAYHYVITLQWQNDLGTKHATYGGVITARPPVTRHELFGYVLETTREALHAPVDAIVVFLSIEPDELG
jgi:hypothetical protein